ncbi:DUF2384 domain-containing protein [Achromobacter sp. KS-M25]|nr:DUF2384 domain-containing protein [Achromobacter aestuarii]
MHASRPNNARQDTGFSLASILVRSGAHRDIDVALKAFGSATTMELIALERSGVDALFLAELSSQMHLPKYKIFELIGLSKARARTYMRANGAVRGVPGMAAIAIIRLACDAQRMIEDSTAPAARGFDALVWLGHWLVLPQPALAGAMPCELLDTSTGVRCVCSVFGAISSGAYQ